MQYQNPLCLRADSCHFLQAFSNDSHDFPGDLHAFSDDLHDDDVVNDEELLLALNGIRSSHTLPEEQAAGKFTRHVLKKMPIWKDWHEAEMIQVQRLHDLGMFFEPCDYQ